MSEYDKDGIIETLMNRDYMDRDDAEDAVADVQYQIDALMDSGCEGMAGVNDAEAIIREELGLEPDYLMAFIGW